jgi:hypothetical protein
MPAGRCILPSPIASPPPAEDLDPAPMSLQAKLAPEPQRGLLSVMPFAPRTPLP